VELDAATRDRLVARFGAAVVEPWSERVPGLVADLAGRWELVVGEPIGRGNTSLVIRCRRAGRGPAILKLSPEDELADAEARALRAWAPTGRVPAVHAVAPGALLLEAIPDGTPLEAAGVEEVAALIGDLHAVAPPPGTPSLAERVDFVFRPGSPFHAGRDGARALAADDRPARLLHGDLHPANVLHGGAARGLVAIDPRPCAGDPAFDAIDWVTWRTDDPRRRCRELAALLGLEAERLWRWHEAFAARAAGGAG
jgi:streptomycin 6-kinase